MSNMIKRSLDPDGQHISPLGTGAAAGRVDEGYANLKVKLLNYPDERVFKNMVYKATLATRGSDIDAEEDIDPQVVEDAFSGGLNQCLEWVSVAFEVSGCSRGLTHELVRTRKASFAQQSMRHTDMGSPAMRMPTYIAECGEGSEEQIEWYAARDAADDAYRALVELDVPYQDARTVLPIATETYIICSYPLSEFINTFAYRACHMFYPEIVVLFGRMRDALLEQAPWLEPYIKISCEKTTPGFIEGGAPGVAVAVEHKCTYQGWERVEGHCPLPWAIERNRVWKSKVFSD